MIGAGRGLESTSTAAAPYGGEVTPEEMVAAAIEVAEAGMAAGETPIGAIVVMGGEVLGSAYASEYTLRRHLAHADLLAMIQADTKLAFTKRPQPLSLAVNLEPCVMCMGAAMVVGVADVYYALESPGDGGAGIAASWKNNPATPFFVAPRVVGGIRRAQSQDLFRRYCEDRPDAMATRWARSLVELPE
jgi:tRNA(adenine34) deaminase